MATQGIEMSAASPPGATRRLALALARGINVLDACAMGVVCRCR